MFFFEHVLMRLEKSDYRNNIILKGGVLLSSIIGEDLRTTKDLDATLKSLPLNEETIRNMFNNILNIDINDNVTFEIESIKDIRSDDEYGGFRINVKGVFDKIRTNFFIEITTGDIITPKEIKYKYNSIFEDKKINILAYNLETILAEKFNSIISRNIVNTRAKDFYDIYYLSRTFDFEGAKLQAAIFETLQRRGTPYDRDSFKRVVALADDEDMQKRWKFFLKTIKDNTLEFPLVIEEIQTFLEPVFDAIVNEDEWQEQWNFIMKWNKNERSPKL